ncbi:MAG: PHP domain-containing protein, partial [Deltaproteobacteria bacterium]|nr:PHP domain-containing protein [Deltaproteobacteria bacterium]
MDRLLAALLALASVTAAAAPLVLEGDVPDDGSPFLEVPFEVPAGTREVEVRHDDLSEANILDFGLHDASGAFRGWGGGNPEPAVVGESAASRSYLPGPLPAGTWRVLVGKAKLVDLPARYRLEVELRAAPTLPPQSSRRAWTPPAPLATGARWYAGDLHVHSRESGDAQPSLDEIATFARGRGLDFAFVSDHNTASHLELLPDAQSRHPGLLLLPSVEFTTYAGHANGLGATTYVDLRLGGADGGIAEAVSRFHAQGALFSVNHPALDLGNVCIGCAWKQRLPRDQVDAVEIQTGRYSVAGVQFFDKAVTFWESVLDTGKHAPAVGGSDDHRGGASNAGLDSAIGSPTTLVYA